MTIPKYLATITILLSLISGLHAAETTKTASIEPEIYSLPTPLGVVDIDQTTTRIDQYRTDDGDSRYMLCGRASLQYILAVRRNGEACAHMTYRGKEGYINVAEFSAEEAHVTYQILKLRHTKQTVATKT